MILSGGLLTSIYYFDTEHKVFLEIFGNMEQGNKFLCAGNGKAYLFHNNFLYVSDIWNPWKWTLVKEVAKLGKYWISAWVRYEDCIYFTTGHYGFFQDDWPKARRFNLTTLEISDII